VNRFAPLESHAVQVVGELCYINPEGDGDLHLELADPVDNCPFGVNPFRLLVVEATPHFQRLHPGWKGLLTESRITGDHHHPEAAVPSSKPLDIKHKIGIVIRVSGLLMRDTHSEGARSGWEIHPITLIECQRTPGVFIEMTAVTDCIRAQ